MRRMSLVLLLFLGSLPLEAGAGGWYTGIHGGSSVPDLRDNGGNELSRGWTSRVAPYFGVFAEYELTPLLSLQSGVDYAPQGGKRTGMQPVITDISELPVPEGTTLYARFKNVAELNYLELPLLATWHPRAARRFSVGLGPYLGILLAARNVTSGRSTLYFDPQGQMPVSLPQDPNNTPLPPQDFGATTDSKSDLRALNWGIQGAAAVEHPLGPGFASLSLRGGLGLRNIQKDSADGKNSTGNLVVALGYGLRFGSGAP